jgi:hypothetical protein
MNETLREKEEAIRIEVENLRKANDELTVLRRKVDQHSELMSEKDRTVQVCIVGTPLSSNHQPDLPCCRFFTMKSAPSNSNWVRLKSVIRP